MKSIKQNSLLKRFPKLHWFDVVIGSIAIVIIVGFFFFFYRKAEYIQIRVKVTDQEVLSAWRDPRNNYSWQFHVGDVERDVVGRVITEIVGVESFPIDPEHKAVYLDLRIRSTYDTRTKTYSARGKNLMYGTPMRFNLENVTFDGFVTETPNGIPLNMKKKTVKVRAFAVAVAPSIADHIKVGDTLTNSLGEVLVRVNAVTVLPHEQITTNSAGNLVRVKNPVFKDVVLDLDLAVKEVNGSEIVMFDDYRVQIEALVPLNTRLYNIYPAIQEIEGL